MKKGFDKFSLHIKSFTPETIPFKRLLEYLSQLEKLFEGEDIHFTKVARGSAAPEFIVKTDDAYKIEEKIHSLNNQDSPLFSKFAKMLQEDKTSAYFAKNNIRIFEIKGANDNLQKYDIKEEYELLGYVIKVGGRDDTVPLSLRDLYDDSIIYNCNTNRNLAKQLAQYLFETPIKLFGMANWIKIGNSEWELKNFNIKSFEAIEPTPIEDDLTKLFEIDEEWYKTHTSEDFIQELRGDDE